VRIEYVNMAGEQRTLETKERRRPRNMHSYKCEWIGCTEEYVSEVNLEYTDGYPPDGWATVGIETNEIRFREIPLEEMSSLVCPKHVRAIDFLLGLSHAGPGE
jgi:hypothetical protein